jgi:aspartate/methionine/tyrosine aminotransferase
MRDINDICVKYGIPSLAQGLIELSPPERLIEITRNTLNEQHVHQYRTRFGEDAYRDGLRNLIDNLYNVKLPREAFLATCGVTAGVVSSLMWLRKQGKSKVAVLEPVYTYHIFQSEMVFEKKPVFIPKKDDFTPNWQGIQDALNDGVQAILTTSPNNPSGLTWSHEDLSRLVEMTEKANCYLILDEVYSEMVWGEKEKYSPFFTQLYKHVLVVRGFSKTLALQSWRLGYVISHPEVISSLMTVHDPIYICVPWYQHSLGEYLLNNLDDFKEHVGRVNSLIRSNWKVLYPVFEKVFGWKAIEPEGTMYGCFYHTEETDRDAVIRALRKGVGICPGTMFLGTNKINSGFVRIHCGVSREKVDKIISNLE